MTDFWAWLGTMKGAFIWDAACLMVTFVGLVLIEAIKDYRSKQ